MHSNYLGIRWIRATLANANAIAHIFNKIYEIKRAYEDNVHVPLP